MQLVLDGVEGWPYKPVHKVRLLGAVCRGSSPLVPARGGYSLMVKHRIVDPADKSSNLFNYPLYAFVAQLEVQVPCKHQVVSSSLTEGSI